jgi:hypothetical protein
MEDPIDGEKIVLGKLQTIFQNTITNRTPKKIQITFRANGINYEGVFDLNYNVSQLIFTNPCSYLQYTYGKNYPYSTRINANRYKEACFMPRLVGPSADVLQILSTKLRLQIPEHAPITIIDEAEKDGVYISKAKLIRGEPTIYEKYGYVTGEFKRYGYVKGQIDYIKEQLQTLKVDILSDDVKNLLEEKAGLPFNDNMLIINVMRRIKPANEKIDDSLYISNLIYDEIHKYLYMKFPSMFEKTPKFELQFDEESDAWKAIKDKVQIIDVLDVTELRKILFIQLPDNIREKVINIDDDVGDDEPVLDILNRIKENNSSLKENIYKYMDNYLKKRLQVEILMDVPLNAKGEKYRIGDLSDTEKKQFYEIFYKYFNHIEEEPIEIDNYTYIADVLRTLKEKVPDFHFDKLYILLYNTFGEGKWENQNGGKIKRQRKTKKRNTRRHRMKKTKRHSK